MFGGPARAEYAECASVTVSPPPPLRERLSADDPAKIRQLMYEDVSSDEEEDDKGDDEHDEERDVVSVPHTDSVRFQRFPRCTLTRHPAYIPWAGRGAG